MVNRAVTVVVVHQLLLLTRAKSSVKVEMMYLV